MIQLICLRLVVIVLNYYKGDPGSIHRHWFEYHVVEYFKSMVRKSIYGVCQIKCDCVIWLLIVTPHRAWSSLFVTQYIFLFIHDHQTYSFPYSTKYPTSVGVPLSILDIKTTTIEKYNFDTTYTCIFIHLYSSIKQELLMRCVFSFDGFGDLF